MDFNSWEKLYMAQKLLNLIGRSILQDSNWPNRKKEKPVLAFSRSQKFGEFPPWTGAELLTSKLERYARHPAREKELIF